MAHKTSFDFEKYGLINTDFNRSRSGTTNRHPRARSRARSNVRAGPNQSARDGVPLRTWSVPANVGSTPRRRFKFNYARPNKHNQNSNNNNDFRKQPEYRRSLGSILKSFHSSRCLEDGAWKRPAGLVTKDNLFKQPLPPSISQNKNCIFPVPETVEPGLRDKVLFELSAGSVIRHHPGQPTSGRDTNGLRVTANPDGEDDADGPEMTSDSSWSVVLMVIAASVRLFYEMWQCSFDFYMPEDEDESSFTIETQL